MNQVNVAVMAPVLGEDVSFVSEVDPRVRVFDANFAGAGDGADRSEELEGILARAEVLLVGYPVPRFSPPGRPGWRGRTTPRPGCRTWPAPTCGPRTSR